MLNDIPSNIVQELNELMEKHANVALAKSVSKYVEDAEKLKVEHEKRLEGIKTLNEELKKNIEIISDLKQQINDLLKQLGDKKELENREIQLKQGEMNLELAKAQYELQCEKKSKEDIYKLVDIVFRNRSYTHATTEQANIPMTVPVGCYATSQPVNNSKTTTLTEF